MNNNKINGKKIICGECNYFAMDWCWTIGVDKKKDDNCINISPDFCQR